MCETQPAVGMAGRLCLNHFNHDRSIYGQAVNMPGLLFGTLTFASLAVMLGLRSDFTISPERWRQLRSAVAWFVIVQSVLGMLQFAASGNPDMVCGTFGLLDFRHGVTICQVYLTFSLFTMIMFLLTDATGRLPKVAIALGLITCALAHSGDQTLFFVLSLALVAMLQLRIKDLGKLAYIFFAVVGLTMTISTVYWADAKGWYQEVAVEVNSPKKSL